MSQIITPQGPPYTPPPPPEDDDEFPLGWRYVRRELPDGTETWDQVPLTLEDRLFPEEGDQALDTRFHRRDRDHCSLALETHYEGDQTVAVLSDHRIDFDLAGIRPMGPDVVVVFDVVEPEPGTVGTYLIAQNGGRAVLAIELGSPKTRTNDQELKPPLYFRAGIEKFVFVDRGPRGDAPAHLNCFRRGRRDWVRMTPDANGRYDLAPVSVLIGLENDRVWLYDAKTGERIPDHAEVVRGKRSAEAKTKKAEAKAKKETKARADAEAKVKKEAKARADAEARAKDAEARAREEVQRSAALEERLREMEEQLRRRQGTE
jgi:colicin import membrane protein